MNEIKEICKINNYSRDDSLSTNEESWRIPFQDLVGDSDVQNLPSMQKHWIVSSALQNKRLCNLASLHLGSFDRRITVSKPECSR